MSEISTERRKARVQGSVERDHDFMETIDRAVAAGLEERVNPDAETDRERFPDRLPRIGVFLGRVGSHDVFQAVQGVEGVKHLEYSQTVHAAQL